MKKIIKENSLFILIVIVITVLSQIRLPYYINTGGGTININNRISYEGKKELKGSLNMLYVTEYVATIPTYLMSYLLRDWDLESIEESRISNETTKDIEKRNKIMLENSINTAKYVAYKTAGEEIKVSSKKTEVIATTLDNQLKIGDEIIKINDQIVEDTTTIKKEIELEIPIQEENNHKIIGIIVITNYDYQTKKNITLHFRKSESGSSGGLMMTLSMYMALTQEDLLKGRKIAGTGTIDMEGHVGEISGIKYKIIGANKHHMDVVLVPKENYKEAMKVAKERNYKMKIVKVETLEEAIEYLKK